MRRKDLERAVSLLECPRCGADFALGENPPAGGAKCIGCGKTISIIAGRIFKFDEVSISNKVLEKTMCGPEIESLRQEIETLAVNCVRSRGVQLGAALDFGCGSSAQVFEHSLRSKEGIVFGLDYDLEPLLIAARAANEFGFPNVFFVQNISCPLPFKNGTFDVITSHQSLEHTDNPREVVREFAKKMKAQAKCDVDFPNGNGVGEKARGWFHQLTKTENPHRSRISLKKAQDIFENSGMEVVAFQPTQAFLGPIIYFIEGFILRFIFRTYQLWEIRKRYYDNFFFRTIRTLENKIQHRFPQVGHSFSFTLEKKIHFNIKKLS